MRMHADEDDQCGPADGRNTKKRELQGKAAY